MKDLLYFIEDILFKSFFFKDIVKWEWCGCFIFLMCF